jgi:uncharacterized protein (UPF0333 family)
MSGTASGVVWLLVGVCLLAIGIVMTYFGGKSVAAGEEGDVNVNGEKVGSSKVVPVIGLIVGIICILGGIGGIIAAIVMFAA